MASKARNIADLLNASGKVTADDLDVGQIGGRRNLIINGAMQVAQRGTSAFQSPTAGSIYTLDRFSAVSFNDSTSRFSIIQDSDAPSGFQKSLKVSVTSQQTSPPSNAVYWVSTSLEGYDVSVLDYGSSNAKTATLSFYIKSSVTGTFAGRLYNSANNRSYVFTYSVNSASTWERVSITIDGDTSGDWLKDNGAGLSILWDLGSGSNFETTAGQWVIGEKNNTSSSVQLINTASATWQITGVQLELGSVATPFEHRSYGEELALCQRYFCKSFKQSTTPVAGSPDRLYSIGASYGTGSDNKSGHIPFPVTMRATPTITLYHGDASGSNASGTISAYSFGGGWQEHTAVCPTGGGANESFFNFETVSGGVGYAGSFLWQASFTADAEL